MATPFSSEGAAKAVSTDDELDFDFERAAVNSIKELMLGVSAWMIEKEHQNSPYLHLEHRPIPTITKFREPSQFGVSEQPVFAIEHREFDPKTANLGAIKTDPATGQIYTNFYHYKEAKSGYWSGKRAIKNEDDLPFVLRWLYRDNPEQLSRWGVIEYSKDASLDYWAQYGHVLTKKEIKQAVNAEANEAMRERIENDLNPAKRELKNFGYDAVGFAADIGITVLATRKIPTAKAAAWIGKKLKSVALGKAVVRNAILSQGIEVAEMVRTGESKEIKDFAESLLYWEAFALGETAAFAGVKVFKRLLKEKAGAKIVEQFNEYDPQAIWGALVQREGHDPALRALIWQSIEQMSRFSRHTMTPQNIEAVMANWVSKLLRWSEAQSRGGQFIIPRIITTDSMIFDKMYKTVLNKTEKKRALGMAKRGASGEEQINQVLNDRYNTKFRYLESELKNARQIGDAHSISNFGRAIDRVTKEIKELAAIDPEIKRLLHNRIQTLAMLKNETKNLLKEQTGHTAYVKEATVTIEASNPLSAKAIAKFDQAQAAIEKVYTTRTSENLRAFHRFMNNDLANVERSLRTNKYWDTGEAKEVMTAMSQQRGSSAAVEYLMAEVKPYFAKFSRGEIDLLDRAGLMKRIIALSNQDIKTVVRLTKEQAKIKSIGKILARELKTKKFGAGRNEKLNRGMLDEIKQRFAQNKKLITQHHNMPMNITKQEAEAFLHDIPAKIGDKINTALNKTQDMYNKSLKELYEGSEYFPGGVISSSDLKAMQQVGYYQQTVWLDHLDQTVSKTGRKGAEATRTMRPSFRKTGEDIIAATDTIVKNQAIAEKQLAAATLAGDTAGIKKFTALLEAYTRDLTEQASLRGMVLTDVYSNLQRYLLRNKNILFRNHTARSARNFAEIAPDNGIFLPALKKGSGFAEAPLDFTEAHAFINGKLKPFYIHESIAKEWVGLTPAGQADSLNTLAWISGSKIIKTFATGKGNPLWAFKNLMLDTSHAYATMYQYSDFLPKFMLQMGKDLKRVSKDVWNQKGIYKDYMLGGGGMPFLSQDSYYTSTKLAAPTKWRAIAENTSEVVNRLNLWSEVTVRAATMRRQVQADYIKKLVSQFGRKLTRSELRDIDRMGWNTLKKKAGKQILQRGIAVARDRTDFAHAGDFWKYIDATIAPYSKAGFVAARSVFRAARENKARFMWRSAQAVSLQVGLTSYMLANHREAYNTLSLEDRFRDFNIPTGLSFRNSKGEQEHVFISYRKDQVLRAITGLADGLTSEFITGEPYSWEDFKKGFVELLPYNPDLQAMPVWSAFINLSTGKEPLTGQSVLPSGVTEQGPANLPEEYDENIHGGWVKLGRASKLGGVLSGHSPYRLRAAASKLVPRNNVFAGIIGSATQEWLRELPETQHKEIAEQLLKSAFGKTVLKTRTGSSTVYTHSAEAQWEAAGEKAELSRFINIAIRQNVNGEVSDREVFDFIQNNVPIEHQETMIRRFMNHKKIAIAFEAQAAKYPKGMPISQKTWLGLLNRPSEVRAKALYSLAKKSTPEMRNWLFIMAETTHGFKNDRFQFEWEILTGKRKRGE